MGNDDMGAVCTAGEEEPKPTSTVNPSINQRFSDTWWRKFDTPTDGYRDSSGFVNRLPLRLESTELIIWGLVDADKMWAEYDDEDFHPILVGGKAVVTVWLNQFTDTDCGGA